MLEDVFVNAILACIFVMASLSYTTFTVASHCIFISVMYKMYNLLYHICNNALIKVTAIRNLSAS